MNENDRNTPDELKDFVLRPAPPHLRTKVLAATKGIRPADRFLTSAQWGMAAACALLILGALSGDAFISGTQARRLDTILNDRPAESTAGNSDRAGLEEFLGADQARSLRLQSTRPSHDQAIWMGERMDKDVLASEDKEDADVHAKNPR